MNGQTSLTASGELYWDEGETIVDNIETYNNYHFEYSFLASNATGTLTINMTKQAVPQFF